MLKRSHLAVLSAVGLVLVAALVIGTSQLISQRDTISNLNQSVAALKASAAAAKDRTPPILSTAKLKTEIDDVLVATLGRNFGTPGGLTGFVGGTTIDGTMTQAIAGLQNQMQSLSSSQPSASTLSTLQADVTSLQDQINTLNTRVGTGPATPDISTLLDQVTAVVTCLRQNEADEAAGNC